MALGRCKVGGPESPLLRTLSQKKLLEAPWLLPGCRLVSSCWAFLNLGSLLSNIHPYETRVGNGSNSCHMHAQEKDQATCEPGCKPGCTVGTDGKDLGGNLCRGQGQEQLPPGNRHLALVQPPTLDKGQLQPRREIRLVN